MPDLIMHHPTSAISLASFKDTASRQHRAWLLGFDAARSKPENKPTAPYVNYRSLQAWNHGVLHGQIEAKMRHVLRPVAHPSLAHHVNDLRAMVGVSRG